jgi:MFS family permease
LIPALLGVLVLFLVREKRLPRLRTLPQEPWWKNLGRRWHALDRRLKIFLAIIFIFALGNSSNQFLLLRAANLGVDNATVILMYLVFNLIYALGSFPFGRLSDKFGRKKLLVLGYFTYGVVYIGFALATQTSLWFLFAVYGLYYALTEGVEKAFVSEIAPQDLRATLIGLHATFVGIGLLPASMFAGFLMTLDPAAPFWFGGGMGTLAAIAFLFLI